MSDLYRDNGIFSTTFEGYGYENGIRMENFTNGSSVHVNGQANGKGPNKDLFDPPRGETTPICGCCGVVRKRKKLWNQEWTDYAQKSTFHGVRYVSEPSPFKIRK